VGYFVEPSEIEGRDDMSLKCLNWSYKLNRFVKCQKRSLQGQMEELRKASEEKLSREVA
jgi:hypothetical protein